MRTEATAKSAKQTLRIETPQAIDSYGTQRVAYPGSRETIESIEAWIIQPNGTKIIVPPESIRAQDEDTGEAVQSSQTQSTRSLYFHRYTWAVDSIGSLSHLFTPLFAGQFFEEFYIVAIR